MGFVALNEVDVERLLPMEDCIEVMEQALVALHRGEMTMPLRTMFAPPGSTGIMAWMPAHRSGSHAVFGMKVLSVIPGNPARGLEAHQGGVLLMDGDTGQLRAVVDASAVTAIRTAAVTAVATRALAREDARSLAIIGTGTQARRHLASIPLVRGIEGAMVAGSSPERARAFVERARPDCGFDLHAALDAEAAVAEADVVVTATSSRQPVLQGAWLRPGMHVNAVGASQPTSRELDTDAVARASLFTDREESLNAEAGEFRLALEAGRIQPGHLRAELGAVLCGEHPGRTSPEEVTLFRSLGLAVEDLAAAALVLERAERAGAGTRVEY